MSNRLRYVVVALSCILVFYIVIGGVLGMGSASNEETYRDLGVYSEVLSRIKSDYVTQPNLQKVTGGAIRGLLEALDPYSTYFTPQQYKDYLAHPETGPAAVGLFVSKKFGMAVVVAVLPGSPADKAGVVPSDLVDRANGQPVRELSAVQIQRELAGQPGTQVDVWIVNEESQGQPQKLTLTRTVLSDPPVLSQMESNNTGYVRVENFDQGEADQVATKVNHLVSEGARSLVLDLRDCAGGEPDEAIKTASLFIQKGLIAYTYGQQDPRHNFDAVPMGSAFKMPLAVLINRSTAGPAEIVASAVLDDKRGDVVGVRSFGVGVVQKAIPIGDGSGLLLSVAEYYGPDGNAIQDNGVAPNIVVPSPGEMALNEGPVVPLKDYGTPKDIQLQKAIQVLQQETPPSRAA
jgi:carboxyl-terminal processing protease